MSIRPFNPIQNGESGSSVREKLNSIIAALVSSLDGVNEAWNNIRTLASSLEELDEQTSESVNQLTQGIADANTNITTQINALTEYVNAIRGGVAGFIDSTSYQPNFPIADSVVLIAVCTGTFTYFLDRNAQPIVVDDNATSFSIFYKAANRTYWEVKTTVVSPEVEPAAIIDDSSSAQNKVWSAYKVIEELATKVNVVAGKQLSTEDFTTAEKTKLANIPDDLGQSDWNQSDSTKSDYIKNKPYIPTKTSDLMNDSSYQTATQVATAVATKQDIMQVSTMPTPTDVLVGNIYQYIGTTDSNYTNGYFYKCKQSGSSYVWELISVQPGSGVTWGGITGSLSEQEDLMTILNQKLTQQQADALYAQKSGVYDNFTAGFAKNLLGRDTDSISDEDSFTFRSAGGNTSIAESAIASLNYVRGNLTANGNGVLQPFVSGVFKSVGFNAFNKDNRVDKKTGYKLDNSGSVVADSSYTLVWIHVLAGTSGSGYNNGYIVKLCGDSAGTNVGNVGFSATKPTSSISSATLLTKSLHGSSQSYLPASNGWLLVSVPTANIDDLCVHLAWSGYNDANTIFKEYQESLIDFSEVMTAHFQYGMRKANNCYDEINFAEQKAYKRVSRVDMGDLEWTEVKDEQEIGGETVEVLVGYKTSDLADLVKPSTTNIVGDVVTNVTGYTVSANGGVTANVTASTTMDGFLYFESASAETYDISVSGAYQSDDFGTEEFVDATIEGYARVRYNTNLIDSIRSMANSGVTFSNEVLTTFNGTLKADSCYELGNQTGINITSIETGFFETNMFFTVNSASFALHLPTNTKVVGEIPDFENGSEYVLSAYRGRVTVAKINVVQ